MKDIKISNDKLKHRTTQLEEGEHIYTFPEDMKALVELKVHYSSFYIENGEIHVQRPKSKGFIEIAYVSKE